MNLGPADMLPALVRGDIDVASWWQPFGWRAEVLGFLVLALAMLPAAWFAGKVDKIALPASGTERTQASAKVALRTAMGSAPFLRKPFLPAELALAVRTALEQGQFRAANPEGSKG